MRIYTYINGKFVGKDIYGNKYYIHCRGVLRNGREMRWVIYNGLVEASKIPPNWHHWLHHVSNEVPEETDSRRFVWQKKHEPNLTGTLYAYRPAGHLLEGAKRDKATGDYQPWTPSDSAGI
ncbi:NADH:ubiquinone oxidoreductase subunit NDUFA12 [Candidatus Endolissoclinum faulkneri]|nr:NADH:ubiquinone oxidoreductase subunit NDUFA12 [Candidatus Endolissoclinum faulkneri]